MPERKNMLLCFSDELYLSKIFTYGNKTTAYNKHNNIPNRGQQQKQHEQKKVQP